PQLTRQQASLHEMTAEVLAFWDAIQAACHWLAELTWSLRPQRPASHVPLRAPWQMLTDCINSEESLTCLLREPGWNDSVQLVGIADAIVRLAETGRWCAVEFKLGKTSPAADLGQACLYHLMLSTQAMTQQDQLAFGATQPVHEGVLSLVSFHPERHERFFSAAELATAKQRLIELIGALAKVIPLQAQVPQSATEIDVLNPAKPAASRIADSRVREAGVPTDAHRNLGKNIIKTLAEYKVNVSLDEQAIVVGAAFLRFPIVLGRGTKVSAVEKLAPELQIHLKLKAEPFIKRDDGQLVIDVQRPDQQKVYFDAIRAQLPGLNESQGGSLIPVGIDLSGTLICADLAKPEHSHLLVAGTTGSGKSEWLRLAIAGLMATNTPETLRLLIIDPKRNAFHALQSSPFLWRPIVFPDEHSTVEILVELSEEMDRRYRLSDGADSFAQMAAKSETALPRIVCVCDEYRDLISRNREERKGIEEQICRLGAKARAAGIHLILATQEPSRDTIKGPLDSNIPARVGLKMGKRLESQMLLNEAGAEKLLGNGDLLFKDIGQPRRLQAPLLTDDNRAEIFGKR
ncbi:MAG: Cell division protein FtsK, partial [Planctomycetaceae bacterium]|nr:Cell division protein FtsK [Planctomycetaceae bacterium]